MLNFHREDKERRKNYHLLVMFLFLVTCIAVFIRLNHLPKTMVVDKKGHIFADNSFFSNFFLKSITDEKLKVILAHKTVWTKCLGQS